jgi:hypothetical protein
MANDLRPDTPRFGGRARALGWQPAPHDDADTRQLRRELVPFVADRGRTRRSRATRATAHCAGRRIEGRARRSAGNLLYTAAHGRTDAGFCSPTTWRRKTATVANDRRDLLHALGVSAIRRSRAGRSI